MPFVIYGCARGVRNFLSHGNLRVAAAAPALWRPRFPYEIHAATVWGKDFLTKFTIWIRGSAGPSLGARLCDSNVRQEKVPNTYRHER